MAQKESARKAARERIGKLVSLAELCDYTGYSEKSIRNMVKDGMPTVKTRPRYVFDTGQVTAWLEFDKWSDEVDENDYEARDVRARALTREFKLEEMKNNTVDIDEFIAMVADQNAAIKRNFLALENTLPLLLEGKDRTGMRLVIRRELDQVLSDLADETRLDPRARS